MELSFFLHGLLHSGCRAKWRGTPERMDKSGDMALNNYNVSDQ